MAPVSAAPERASRIDPVLTNEPGGMPGVSDDEGEVGRSDDDTSAATPAEGVALASDVAETGTDVETVGDEGSPNPHPAAASSSPI